MSRTRQADHELDSLITEITADSPGQRLALKRSAEKGCGRDTGARIFKALEGQSRAADSVSPNDLRFATSVTRTQRKDPTGRCNRPVSFIRRGHHAFSVRSRGGRRSVRRQRGRRSPTRLSHRGRARRSRALVASSIATERWCQPVWPFARMVRSPVTRWPGLDDPAEFLAVDVDELARSLPLVADDLASSQPQLRLRAGVAAQDRVHGRGGNTGRPADHIRPSTTSLGTTSRRQRWPALGPARQRA